jgi:hypothetical protein
MEQTSQSTAPNYPPLELGPRTIPIPEHVSSQAQQLIAMPRLNLLPASYPPLHDKAALAMTDKNDSVHLLAHCSIDRNLSA